MKRVTIAALLVMSILSMTGSAQAEHFDNPVYVDAAAWCSDCADRFYPVGQPHTYNAHDRDRFYYPQPILASSNYAHVSQFVRQPVILTNEPLLSDFRSFTGAHGFYGHGGFHNGRLNMNGVLFPTRTEIHRGYNRFY